MIKTELNELLKDIADDVDIDETIKGNSTLAKLFEKGLTLDDVKNFLDSNEDGKKYLQSYGDTRVTAGIDSWKKNNLQKEIDTEILKRYPKKDPKDLEMENMKKEIENMKAESAKKDLKNSVMQLANKTNFPIELVDYFMGKDEETTSKNFEKYFEIKNKDVSAEVDKRFKGGYKPPKETREPVDESKMTDAEWFAAHEQKQ